jgi:hypothetical protein
MSDNLLKEKFNDFIKIIDSYEDKKELVNIVEENNCITTNNESKNNNSIIDDIQKSENILNESTNTNMNNPNNKYESSEHDEIFKILHSLLCKQTDITIDKNETNNEDNKKDNKVVIINNDENNLEKNKKTKTKTKIKNKKTQLNKLNLLYEKQIQKNDSTTNDNNKNITYKDNLKKICKEFEENCLMESTRGFNVRDDLYYINMDILKKNIIEYNMKLGNDYECSIFYRNFKDLKIKLNPDTTIGWMEITRKGDLNISSKNKYLVTSLNLFKTTDKFRKTINNVKIRAFKMTFNIYKTNTKIELFCIVKDFGN